MQKATYVKEITVIDPDTNNEVQLTVYKHQNGGMLALDSSFVEQLPPLTDEDDIRCRIVDPLSNPAEPNYLILEE